MTELYARINNGQAHPSRQMATTLRMTQQSGLISLRLNASPKGNKEATETFFYRERPNQPAI
jgi:hypothetical protein